jgi:hypothetical protein
MFKIIQNEAKMIKLNLFYLIWIFETTELEASKLPFCIILGPWDSFKPIAAIPCIDKI